MFVFIGKWEDLATEYLTGHFLSYPFRFGICRIGLSIWTPDTIIKLSPTCFHVLNKLALILGQYCRKNYNTKAGVDKKNLKD